MRYEPLIQGSILDASTVWCVVQQQATYVRARVGRTNVGSIQCHEQMRDTVQVSEADADAGSEPEYAP